MTESRLVGQIWLGNVNNNASVILKVLLTHYLPHLSNKGAVAISLLFGSRSLLFINCHLRGTASIILHLVVAYSYIHLCSSSNQGRGT